ncbi:MAG: ribosome hibernation-promoting factor, HPF/YfiA family [Streptosporangiaceae bacterium]
MDIIFKGRHTDVLDRFRKHATAKLSKIEKLDQKAIRIDVEVSTERNPRQSGRKERVELTITCRGPSVRAEAAAEDRFAAFDLAFAKLESRLRRASDRRKGRHGGRSAIRLIDLPEAGSPSAALDQGAAGASGEGLAQAAVPRPGRSADGDLTDTGIVDDVVPIEMEGDGPLVVREKFHAARPMSIDEALFEMELVGHDFFLFRDAGDSLPSVVYRRRGYQYGVLRLIEDQAAAAQDPDAVAPVRQNGQSARQPSNARLAGA